MEQFAANLAALDDDQKRRKLDQIVMILRQNNAHRQAEAFQELYMCYPVILPFPEQERQLREYMAWNSIVRHEKHPGVRQIVAQG